MLTQLWALLVCAVCGVLGQDFLYAFGGLTSSGSSSTAMTRQDINLDDPWVDAYPSLSYSVSCHTVTYVPSIDKMILVGGKSSAGSSRSSIYSRDPFGDWVQEPSMDVTRACHATALLGADLLIIAGGHRVTTSRFDTASVEALNATNMEFIPDIPLMTRVRDEAALVAIGDTAYAIGGWMDGAGTNRYHSASYESIKITNPMNDTWTAGASMSVQRSGLCAVVLQGKIHAIGGWRLDYAGLSSTEILDPTSGVWSMGPSLQRTLYGHACAVYNDVIYVSGGSTNSAGSITSGVQYSDGTAPYEYRSEAMAASRTRHQMIALYMVPPTPAPTAPLPSAPDQIYQWVVQGLAASTEYSGYEVDGLEGVPDVATYGDDANSWGPSEPSAGLEWVEFRVATPINLTEIYIYESYSPGAIEKIFARNGSGWVLLWSGTAEAQPSELRIFQPNLTALAGPTDTYRIELDSTNHYYPEIDAVGLLGYAQPVAPTAPTTVVASMAPTSSPTLAPSSVPTPRTTPGLLFQWMDTVLSASEGDTVGVPGEFTNPPFGARACEAPGVWTSLTNISQWIEFSVVTPVRVKEVRLYTCDAVAISNISRWDGNVWVPVWPDVALSSHYAPLRRSVDLAVLEPVFKMASTLSTRYRVDFGHVACHDRGGKWIPCRLLCGAAVVGLPAGGSVGAVDQWVGAARGRRLFPLTESVLLPGNSAVWLVGPPKIGGWMPDRQVQSGTTQISSVEFDVAHPVLGTDFEIFESLDFVNRPITPHLLLEAWGTSGWVPLSNGETLTGSLNMTVATRHFRLTASIDHGAQPFGAISIRGTVAMGCDESLLEIPASVDLRCTGDYVDKLCVATCVNAADTFLWEHPRCIDSVWRHVVPECVPCSLDGHNVTCVLDVGDSWDFVEPLFDLAYGRAYNVALHLKAGRHNCTVCPLNFRGGGDHSLEISGEGMSATQLDFGGGRGFAFAGDKPTSVLIRDLALTGAGTEMSDISKYATVLDIYDAASVVLERVEIANNRGHLDGLGDCIWAGLQVGAQFTIIDSEVRHNIGDVITTVYDGSTLVIGTLFEHNQGSYVVYSALGTTTIQNSTFRDNQIADDGYAVYVQGAIPNYEQLWVPDEPEEFLYWTSLNQRAVWIDDASFDQPTRSLGYSYVAAGTVVWHKSQDTLVSMSSPSLTVDIERTYFGGCAVQGLSMSLPGGHRNMDTDWTLHGWNHCCAAGSGRLTQDSKSCAECPPGTFTSAGEDQGLHQTDCLSCQSGRFSAVAGARSSLTCKACAAGRVSRRGSAACTDCLGGTFVDGNERCTTCPIGRFSTNATTHIPQCSLCPSGSVALAGSTTCTQCGAGQWPASNHSVCASCPSGSFSARSDAGCEVCADNEVAQEGSHNCTTCGAGEAPDRDRAICVACPSGMFSNDSTHCELCPAGKYSPNTRTIECAACPANRECGPGSIHPGSSRDALLSKVALVKQASPVVEDNARNMIYLAGFLVSLLLLAVFVILGIIAPNCFKRLTKCDMFAYRHPGDQKPYELIVRRTPTGGVASICCAVLMVSLATGLLVDYSVDNVVETQSTLPGTASLLILPVITASVIAFGLPEEVSCVTPEGECAVKVESTLRGAQGQRPVAVCSEDLDGCTVTWTCTDCSITGSESDVLFSFEGPTVYAQHLAFSVSANAEAGRPAPDNGFKGIITPKAGTVLQGSAASKISGTVRQVKWIDATKGSTDTTTGMKATQLGSDRYLYSGLIGTGKTGSTEYAYSLSSGPVVPGEATAAGDIRAHSSPGVHLHLSLSQALSHVLHERYYRQTMTIFLGALGGALSAVVGVIGLALVVFEIMQTAVVKRKDKKFNEAPPETAGTLDTLDTNNAFPVLHDDDEIEMDENPAFAVFPDDAERAPTDTPPNEPETGFD